MKTVDALRTELQRERLDATQRLIRAAINAKDWGRVKELETRYWSILAQLYTYAIGFVCSIALIVAAVRR